MSTTRRENLRVALVGCGRVSAHHIAVLKALTGVEIVAVCDLDERRARQVATRHAIQRCYGDTETMLRETRLDAVHLLTPPASHLALARVAAEYGLHMYIENPFAANEAAAREILELARIAGIQVCPGHNRLFDPVFVETCRRIAEGEIGTVISVRAEQGFTYDAAARSAAIPWSYSYDWGTFDNLASHPLYLACHILADPGKPQVAGFNLGTMREAGVEEIRALIPSSNGIGEVSLSLCASPEVNRVEVTGTRGRIIADWETMTVSTSSSRLPGAVKRLTGDVAAAFDLARAGLSTLAHKSRSRVDCYAGLRNLIAQFYGNLAAGLPSPVSPEQGVLNVRLMDQIKEACEGVRKQRPPLNGRQEAQPRILVTGASGFLGGRMVEILSEQGTPVRGTTRIASRARQLPRVEWVQCDLSTDDGLRIALRNVETVFHCAALRRAPGSLEDFEEANVRGTLRLVRLAAEAGVKTLVHVSSMSVYAAPGGTRLILDESSPYDGRAAERGAYIRSKLAADAALLEYARRELSPRIIVLRPGTI